MPSNKRRLSLQKALVFALALGSILAGSSSNLANAAVVKYCGQIKLYDQWGNSSPQDATYDSGLAKCVVSIKPGRQDRAMDITQLNNFSLPGHVTSVDVYGVAGGGSTAMDTNNWWDSYFQWNQGNYSYNTILTTDSGGGGGGGAGFHRTGMAIAANARLKMSAGQAGMLDESLTLYGMANGSAGWFGNNGGDTAFGYSTDGGVTFTTITAGGGKAPATYASNGGVAGAVSGTTAGWTTYGGSVGNSRASNNGSSYGGYYIGALSGSYLGQGGGTSSGGWPVGKGAGLGSGGAGSYVDSGASLYGDIPCNMSQYRYSCDGNPGAIVLAYAAVDFIPAYLDYAPSLNSGNPKVGDVLDVASSVAMGADVTPAPTTTYAWYRCSGSVAYSWDNNPQATGCTAISGATGGTYTLVSADLGYKIQAKVTVSNSGLLSNTATTTTSTVAYYTETTGDFVVTTPSAPTVGTTPTTKTPTTAKVTLAPSASWGSTYSFTAVNSSDGATVGTATYDGSTYLNIAGLTANTAYSLKIKQNNTVGASVGSTATLSFTTPLAVTYSAAPTLSVDPRQNKTGSYTKIAAWSGNSTPTVTTQWYYCNYAQTAVYQSEGALSSLTSGCTSTGAANAATLFINSSYMGKYLTVIETAVDSYSTAYYRSASSTIVTGAMDPPTNLVATSPYWYRATISYTMPTFTGSSTQQTSNKSEYSADGGVTWVSNGESLSSATSVMFNTLSGGITYQVRIAIKNSSNTYSAWATTTFTTPKQLSVATFATLSGGGTIGNTVSINPGTYVTDGTATTGAIAWYGCPSATTPSFSGATGVTGCVGLGATFNNLSSITPAGSNFNTYYYVFASISVSDNYGGNGYVKTATVLFTKNPDPPTAVAGTATSPTAMSVSFTAPQFFGASAITSYKYSVAAGPSFSSWSTPAFTNGGTASAFTITTGLTAGTAYKVRVYANNAAGTSVASVDSSTVAQPLAPSISGVPTVSGTAAVGSTITGSISPLTVTGDPTPVLTYSWYACANTSDAGTLTGSCAAITNETTDTLAVTVGQSMKYLVFRVVATNTYGSAIARSAATAQVPGVPGAPTAVSATAAGTSSLQVSYTLPTDVGGGPITSIEYQYAASPYSSWTTFTAAPNMAGSLTITGLASNTSYQVVLRAVNAIGNGTASTASVAVATLGAPVASIAPTLAGTAFVGQVITATEPVGMFTGNATPTISARAWYSCPASKTSGASLSSCTAIGGATSTSFTLTSAQLGKYVVYAATGTNASGSAVASSASTAIVADVADAPTVSSVTLNGSGSISVSIAPGADNNSAITGYAYELNASGTWTATGSIATTFTIGSLTNGSQYALRVRAINAAGNSVGSTSTNFTTLAVVTGGTAASGSGVLNLSWTAVAGATSYTVSYSTSAGSGYVNATGACAAPTSASCALSGLTVASSYYFKVTANNANGSAPISSAFGPTTVLLTAAISGTPSLSGSFSIGSVVTADESGMTVLGYLAPTLTRAWYACDSALDASTLTGSCAAISGATSTTFTVTSAESRKYLVYRITATNALGSAAVRSATSQMIAGVPDVLSTFTLTATSTSAISVLYVAPADDGGSAVTSVQYKYAASPFSSWSSWVTVPISSTTFTISGLTSNTDYRVIMRAINAIGVGADSSASASVTVLGTPTVAIAPTLAGSAAVGQVITATEPLGMFAGTPAPSVSGRQWYSCPTTRIAGASLLDCNAISGATATWFTATVAELGSYLVYAATGTNSSGNAKASSAATAVIATVPSAPTITGSALNGTGSTSITVALGAANFSTISDIQYEVNASGNWVSTGSVNTTFTIGSLTNGSASAIRVRAVNTIGNSLASTASNVTPLAVTSGGAANRGDAQLALSWSATAGATGYVVTYSTSAGSGYLVASGLCAAPTNTSCVLTGLTNGTAYYFKVMATNANGNGPVSTAVGPTTPLSQNANLAGLIVRAKVSSVSTPVGVSFSSAFAGANHNYSADVSAANQYVTVTPTQGISGQVLKVNGTTVSSGAQSADIAIAYGVNIVTVLVQSPDRVADTNSTAVATYTVNITRLNPDLTAFTNFSGSTTAASPVTSTFTNIGITGVTNSNVAAVNSAIAALPSASIDSPAELQQVVNSYVAVLAQAGGGNPSTPPTASDYATIGITPAQTFSPAQVTYLNSVVASLSAGTAADINNVRVVAAAIANLYSVAAGSNASPVTVAQLTALGITGVTSANLADVLAAIAATPDNGSGIDTLAEVQALVDSVKASSVSAIVSATANNSTALPTPDSFASAGVTGVSASNLVAVNAILANLPSGSKDSTVELQAVVNSLTVVLAQADRTAAPARLPVANDYAVIGATAAAALSNSGIALLNNLLTLKAATAIDSVAELNALAAAVSIIQTSVGSATVSEFGILGIKGVTASNLATIQTLIAAESLSGKDSLAELQLIVDKAAISDAATAFANSVAGSSSVPVIAPTVQDFLAFGVQGVSSSNVTALNTAIRAAAAAATPAGSWVATPSAIQALVATLTSAPLATVSSYAGTGSAPAIADFQAIGVVGVKAGNIAAINSFIAALPQTATDSASEVQVVVASYSALVAAVTNSLPSQLSVATLQALGVTGVTSANLNAIASAIVSAGIAGVDTLAELQAVVTAAVSAATASVTDLVSYSVNPAATPELTAYVSAGLVGVSASNKSFIDVALATANPSPTTAAEIQAIIDAVVAAPVAQIAAITSPSANLRLADFALAGITGVTADNRAAVVAFLAGMPATSRDSVIEIQSVIDSFVLIQSTSRGGVNALQDVPKPSVNNFVAIGVDLGPIASDPQAFEFFLNVVAKLPTSVSASPTALTERAAIVAALLRVASGKEAAIELTPAQFASIGLAGVTTANVNAVLTEIATGTAGIAGLDAIEAAMVKYELPIVVRTPTRDITPSTPVTPTPTPVDPTPAPTATPTVKVAPPARLTFPAGATSLTAAAKSVVESQVAKLLKTKAKTIVVHAVVTLPKNSSKTWSNQVISAGQTRANLVAKVVAAKIKALKTAAKVIVKVTTTIAANTRIVKISGTK